jgi:hypothetical protein
MLLPCEIKYAKTPIYGTSIRTTTQIALPKPEISWRRNRSPATEISSQNHMMKTNIVRTSMKKISVGEAFLKKEHCDPPFAT